MDFDTRRQRLDKPADVKRPVQPHLQHADFFALFDEIIHRFVRRFAAGTHQHDDALGIGRADVIEQLVGAAHDLGELVHRLLHDLRAGGVKRIARLAALEKDVGILRRAAQHRLVGRHRPRAMFGNQFVVNQRAQIGIGQHLDLRHFVRGAEAVEEMHEGNSRPQRGRLRNQREIRGLLHAGRAEHGPAGRAAGHDVAVIAENGKRVRGHGAGGDVENRGQQFAGDLEHVGDHQQQSLRRRERGGQRAGLQRAVDAPTAPPSLCISTMEGMVPQRFLRFSDAHWSHHSAMGEEGVMG